MPEIDFSEFHPLDHSILDPYCWGWAGGIPRHIHLWWLFQFQWPWHNVLARRSCHKGYHNVVAYWNSMPAVWDAQKREWVDRPADGLTCRDCDWHRKA